MTSFCINRATLLGRLGHSPIINRKKDGRLYAKLSIATSEDWTDKTTGQKQVIVEWHNVTVFGEGVTSFIENYVKKGDLVYLEGKIQKREYIGKDGTQKIANEIIVSSLNGKFILVNSKQLTIEKSTPLIYTTAYEDVKRKKERNINDFQNETIDCYTDNTNDENVIDNIIPF